jgi:5'-nucleotidase
MAPKSKNNPTTKTHDIALFDLDGTLADYDGRMNRDLRRIQRRGEFCYSPHDHKAPRYFGTRLDLIKAQQGWWIKLPKLKLGFDILHLAIDLGFQVQVLTMGPHNTPSAWMEKVLWCHKNIGRFVKVTVTEDKSLVFGKILVDDTGDYLTGWLRQHPDGLGILPVNANNIGFRHPRVIRYDGTNLDAVRKRMQAVLQK